MSFTNPEMVNRHISLDDSPIGLRRDYPVVFGGTEWVNLPGRGVVEGSVMVKAVREFAPTYETPILNDGEISVSHQRLVPGSVTIASDNSLGAIYRENVDFSVDCDQGTIKRLIAGDIISGSQVAVWYYFYTAYKAGVDYAINCSDGMICRLPDGAIQVGQTLMVDYELSGNWFNDEIISGAVSEANAIVEKQVDPDQRFGADPVLQAAATYLAVSLLCRMAAAGDLKFNPEASSTASSWIALADSYREDYQVLIMNFRPGAARMSRPTLSRGGK
nr:hypothetical protein [candidate division Zixibacteria bacterium]